MEVKLIKTEVNYLLKNEEGVVIAATSLKNLGLSLSLKNCQTIERGYDLDELVSERLSTRFDENSGYHKFVFVEAYKEGFQKALEILGDKKYSEEDMLKSFSIGVFTEKEKGNHTFEYEEYIQSLQQTEWDVIIKTTCDGMVTGLCMPEVCDCNIIPKLDADGCLILKRI